MSLPKEPRQKMINMMYLVLTALLALNVSAEILNAFRTVNSSLLNANGIIDAKNQGIFQSFDKKVQDPKTAEKAKIWRDKAEKARVFADNMTSYIESLKSELMKESGQKQAGGDFKEDNLDEGTKGKELQRKLGEYRDNLLSIDPEIKAQFANTLPIDLSIPKSKNEGNKEWEAAYFRMTLAIAAITMLSKFQNDVKNILKSLKLITSPEKSLTAWRFSSNSSAISWAGPVTRLATPAGRPASIRHSKTCTRHSGVWLAGLQTIVQA